VLEDRTLLAAAANVFAQFSGVVAQPGAVQQIPITLSAADFTLPNTKAILGFHVKAAPGSTLDPADVTIATAAGATVTPSYTNPNLANNTQSLTLDTLPYGNYVVSVAGQGGTSGAFQLEVFLAGDANGAHRIDLTDGAMIRAAFGSIPGSSRYLVAADSNLDGEISSFDYTQWRNNMGAATPIAPLTLALQVPAGVVMLPSGSLATATAVVTLRGTTEPGATVALETGADGNFDGGTTIADASGNFAFNVTLAGGGNTLQVMASDPFGQHQTAGISILLDTHAPVVTLTAPTPGLATHSNIMVFGDATDDLTGVAYVQAALDGGSYVPLALSPAGNFTFPTTLALDGSADGTYTVHVRAADLVGNVSTPVDLPFTLDTVPPVITVTSPTPNTVTNQNVTVAGQVTDDRSGVASLQAELDGGTFVPVILGSGGSFSISTNLAVDHSADGPHTEHLKATDNAGNVSTLDVSFTLDTVPPVITVTSPPANTVTNQNVTVAGQVTDNGSGVASLQAALDGGAFAPLTLGSGGSFSFLTTLALDHSADGPHTEHLKATDNAGNVSSLDVSFTLDTVPPVITVTSPPPNTVTNQNVTVTGQVTDDRSGVASLQEAIDGGSYSPVAFDSSGHFSFVTTLPLDSTADGPHTVSLRATDSAGNISTPTSVPFTLQTIGAGGQFSTWTAMQEGGSATGKGGVIIPASGATLYEGDSFAVTLSNSFVVPSQPSVLTFTYSNLNFDTPVAGEPLDAFEAAFVDAKGNSLVHTIAGSRDAFFNITEGQTAATGTEAVASGQTVTLDLSHIISGTTGRLIFRVVNNDGPGTSSVTVDSAGITAGPGGISPAPIPAAATATSVIDFSQLSDVTASVQTVYGQTSLNEQTQVLYANLSAANAGQYAVDAPLVAVIEHLSNPSIHVRGADGLTPGSQPYYDFSSLIAGGKLVPGAATGSRTISFYDPSDIPFTYDAVFLGQLNRSPAFTSTPNTEALFGHPYTYGAAASDPDGDPLTFSLVSGPSGTTVDAATGQVTWAPAAGDMGNQAVALRVDDGRGGSAEQDFTLSVVQPPPDRPPVFTSTPVVIAHVDAAYQYQATATDPDQDPLTFSLTSGPQGMTVDPASGQVQWQPTASQLGVQNVALTVSDSRGGSATQTYSIDVHQQPGNQPPLITSNPLTAAVTGLVYSYPVRAFDSDNDSLTFSLTSAPAGMTIDPSSGLIQWTPLTTQTGSQSVEIRVDDGRGGFDTQTFTLNVTAAQSGSIQGTVFNDVNGDGSRDLIGGNPAPVTPLNVPGTADIYLAGMADGSTASGGGDTAPRQSPLLVTGLNLSVGETLMVTVPAGAVNNSSASPTMPDGNGLFTAHTGGAENGISDVVAPTDALVGVFLGPNQPDGFTAPAPLDFSAAGDVSGGIDYSTLSPQLQQVFFIGDGRTRFGDVQGIIVPPGAMRFYVGVMAAGATSGNYGSMAVVVQPYDVATAPPPFNLVPVGTPDNGAFVTSLTYYEPDKSLLAAEGPSGGLIEIKPDGSASPFSLYQPQLSYGGETYLASAQWGNLGGFTPGDVFLLRANDASIARISNNGQTVIDPWVKMGGGYLYGEGGGITFDQTGVFGGDLIAVTTQGAVWQIDAKGNATLLAQLDESGFSEPVEGVAVLPDDPTRYGPLAGCVIVGQNDYVSGGVPHTGLWAIDAHGTATFYDLGLGAYAPGTDWSSPDAVGVVQPNENLFTDLNQQFGLAQGVSYSEISSMTGDIFVLTEGLGLFRVFWNGESLQAQNISDPSFLTIPSETLTFTPAGIGTLPPVPGEPGLAGWTVYLDLNHDGKLDPGDPFTTTDANGHYSFNNVVPGTYTVAEVGETGWRQTEPASGAYMVAVQSGQTVEGIDFGNTQLNAPSSRPPAITSTPPDQGTVGQRYQYQAMVDNPDGQTLTFDLPVSPDGMVVDPSTGAVAWIPTADELGTQNVILRLRDARGDVALQQFQITVGTPPLIVSQPVTTAVLGQTYQYPVKAIDADNDPLNYSLQAGPQGMTINPASGLIQWTPLTSQVGSQNVVVRVDDGRGGFDTQSYILTVNNVIPGQIQGRVFNQSSQSTQQVTLYVSENAPDFNGIDQVNPTTGTVTRLFNTGTYVDSLVFDNNGDIIYSLLYSNQLGVFNPTLNTNEIIATLPGPTDLALDPGGNSVVVNCTGDSTTKRVDLDTGAVTTLATNIAPAIVGGGIAYDDQGNLFVAVNQNSGETDLLQLDPQIGTVLQTIPLHAANEADGVTFDPVTRAFWIADFGGPGLIEVSNYLTSPQVQEFFNPGGSGVDFYDGIESDGQGNIFIANWQRSVKEYNIASNTFTAVTGTLKVDDVAPVVGNSALHPGLPRFTVFLDLNHDGKLDPGDPSTTTDANGFYSFANLVPGSYSVAEVGQPGWTQTAPASGTQTVTVLPGQTVGRIDFGNTQLSTASPRPPKFTSTPPNQATVAQRYQYQPVVDNPDGELLTFDLPVHPAGMVVDPATGVVRWIPTSDELGSQNVILRLTNGEGLSLTQSFNVTVRAVNLPPVITSEPPTQAGAGQSYTYAIQANDVDGDSLTYSLTAGPAGMTIDPNSGLIQWTPTTAQAGTQSATFLVDDGQGQSATQSWNVVVSATPLPLPPTITSTPSLAATVGQPYTYQVTATDPQNETLTYSLVQVPSGMTIDPGSGLVQWTPGTTQTGSQTVKVIATNQDSVAAYQTFALNVIVNQPPVISSTAPTTITAGLLYAYDVQATDPDGDPLTYTLTTGPTGMTLDSSGRLRWTTGIPNIGTAHVGLTVDDDRGGSVAQSFDVSVEADTQAPKVNLSFSPNPADLGSKVTFLVSAADNVGVTALDLTVGGTPVALDPTGRATLTMNNAGDISIVATASDAAGNIGTASGTLSVINPSVTNPPTVSFDTPADGSVITAPTNVTGTVTDSNLLYYTLSVAPVGSDTFTQIARGTSPVSDSVLGEFDPSMLPNGSYDLRLYAKNAGGLDSTIDETVSIAGGLKLGNFRLAFTDLSIPVSGVPITITRSYDSLNAATSGDFGYGWRLDIAEAQLQTSVAPTGIEADGIYNAFQQGTRVYVTLPGGKREGFTFTPTLAPGLAGSFLGIYNPSFTPDAGVTDQLTVPTASLMANADGTFAAYADGLAYNPADSAFAGYYVVTTKDGLAYQIDGNTGQILKVTDANGNTLTITASGILSSAGPQVTFTRDPQGRITAITDPAGKQILYTYDAAGDLTAVTDRTGNTTQFVYGAAQAHYLTQVIDPLGNTGIRTDYDAQGRLVTETDADGKSIQLSYDPTQSTETVKDQLGNPTTYVYDSQGNIVKEVDALGGVTTRTFDANNNMLSETDPLGRTTSYTYDSSGNTLSETDPTGQTTLYTYQSIQFHTALGVALAPFTVQVATSDPLGNTTTNAYDASGNLLSTTDALGHGTTFTYAGSGNPASLTDANGNTTAFTYDGAGRLLTQTDASGRVTTYAYDANGNQIQETTTLTTPTGVRTLVTKTEYDANGRVTKVTDAEGNVTQTQYDAAGNRVASIDALGHKTQYAYDDRGELIKTTYPDGTTTQTEYDAAGHQTAAIDQAGRRTTMKYDALGRLIETDYPDGTHTATEFDAAGEVTAEIDERGNRTQFTYDAASRESSVKDALGNTSTTTYDTAGRVVAQTDPLGHTTRYVLDALGRQVETDYVDGTKTSVTYDAGGRVTSRTDQLGRTTSYQYDALGRLTGVLDALGQQTTYGYDEAGDLITQKDANGHVTSYEYDGLGRRTATVLPLGQRSATSYDADGNVVSTTDFNGATITYDYDSMNRLVDEHLPGGASLAYAYTVTGQRGAVSDARGQTTYTYDGRDRLLSRTDPDGTAISYTYDAAGNRTSVTTPAGVTGYTFDVLNRVSQVTDIDGNVTKYIYDAAGNLVETDSPNSIKEVRQYDVLNRLVYIEDDGSSGVLASFRYTLGPTGRRDALLENNGRQTSYSYDALDRLTHEAIIDAVFGNRAIDYTYDAVGNRLTRNDSIDSLTQYSYDANDRLMLESIAGVQTQYTYDSNGNTLSKVTSASDQAFYHWDALNRMVGADVTDGTGTHHMTYAYNPDGIRVSQTIDGTETRYFIDTVQPYAQVLLEYSPGGAIQASYTYGNGLISQNRAGALSYYVVDGLGSTRALTNGSGMVTDRYVYDAFGRTLGQTGSTVNSYLFAGQQRDATTGLDYLRWRYMSTDGGRFLSSDPVNGHVSKPITLNKFVYAGQNPTDNSDPSGTDFDLASIQTGLTIAGTVLNGALALTGSFLSGFFVGQSAGYILGNYQNWTQVRADVDRLLSKAVLATSQTGVQINDGFLFNDVGPAGDIRTALWYARAKAEQLRGSTTVGSKEWLIARDVEYYFVGRYYATVYGPPASFAAAVFYDFAKAVTLLASSVAGVEWTFARTSIYDPNTPPGGWIWATIGVTEGIADWVNS
jgi:RHS repeat-associated protein